MPPTLRPLTLGEILDKTFAIYRKRFLAFAGLSAIPAAAQILLMTADQLWWNTRPPQLARMFGTFNIGVPLYVLASFHVGITLQLFLYPSITHLCAADDLGVPSGVSESLRVGFKDWRANLSLTFVQLAITLIVPEAACLLLLTGTAALEAALKIDTSELGAAFAPTLGLFILAGIVAYFWMWSCAGLSWAAFDREDLGVRQAVRRSFSLSCGRRWSIFLAQLVPIALWWTFAFVAGFLSRLLLLGLRDHGVKLGVVFPIYVTAALLGRWVIESLVCPIFPMTMTLFYYDQRVRKEGFDVEMMMQAAGLTPEAGGSGAGGLVPGLASFDPGPESAWSRFVKFIRSLRGFD